MAPTGLIDKMREERLRRVKTNIRFDELENILLRAEGSGRSSLFEHEVYRFMKALGSETPPRTLLLPVDTLPAEDTLMSMPGDKVVLKIVSPAIMHKTEVGGVRIVEKDPDRIRSTWRRMLYEIPENYAAMIERDRSLAPEAYADLHGRELEAAISLDIAGVLMVQYMPPDSSAFGNELIVGLRNTREFGMVISAGLGGTDTELYAEYFRKDRAIVSAATQHMDGLRFFELFSRTVSYKKLTGSTRGQGRIVTDEQLVECFSALIKVANHFSPQNPRAPYVLEEFEINPFAFSDFRMVPLDGLCSFSRPSGVASPRPVAKIDNLLHPQRMGIIGVSPSRMNFGRIILQNVLGEGYPADQITVLHPDAHEIDGVLCTSGLNELDEPLDLLVVAVGADRVPDLVDEVINGGMVRSVLLIPGGLGETEDSRERAESIIARINEAHESEEGGPVFLGGNSMGVISHPGQYDTWFLPEDKLAKQRGSHRRNTAFISQSGAFMGTRMSQRPTLDPAYLISVGNQTDLTLGDFMQYFSTHDDVDVIGVYAEGFNDLDGAAFAQAVREAVLAGKEVVFYKAGRTPEGRQATSSHTASLAGDYTVCEACLTQAGAMVARNISQFEDLLRLASSLHEHPVNGGRLAGFSSAGFEAVGIADYIHTDDYRMKLSPLTDETRAKLSALMHERKLDSLVEVKNPLDITPGSTDPVFAAVADILDKDETVDALIAGLVPITPSMHSVLTAPSAQNPEGIVSLLKTLAPRMTTPTVVVVDGGRTFHPFIDAIEALGFPVFTCVDRAVESLSTYIKGRLFAQMLRSDVAIGFDTKSDEKES